jgi:hypothetical protein
MAKPKLLILTSKKSAAPTAAAKTITDLNDFINQVSVYAKTSGNLKCYRGQKNVSWSNVPGLFRPDLNRLEQNEKRAVRDLISVHPNEFASDETMFDKLVRMQHFGLPTRLMDVSLNPLVALYFATDPGPKGEESDGQVTAFSIPEGREKYFDSDAVSCLANLSNLTSSEKNEIIKIRKARTYRGSTLTGIKDINKEEVYERLHQFIRVEKPYFLPIIKPIDLFKPYYVHPKMSNRRILSQAGAFIIYGLQPPNPISYVHKIEETKFTVPQSLKVALRAALQLLGINESTLFPELDRAAKRIANSYAGK